MRVTRFGAYGRLVTYRWWPLFDLRLTTPDLELRPLREADLDLVASRLPDDHEQDPRATRYPGYDLDRNRGIIDHQSYWRAWGDWRPDDWRLPFLVSHQGQYIGVQELEGTDFVRLRTVDSSSFLITEARGAGFGKQMRRAVLALAFGPLEAEAAITSTWHDNPASLGVSRSVGYRLNGESRNQREDTVDTFVHLRMLRADWLATGAAADVTITGIDGCLPLFGLPAGGTS